LKVTAAKEFVACATEGKETATKTATVSARIERRAKFFNQIRIMILRVEECAPGLTAHLQHHQNPNDLFVPRASDDSTSE
jgi:hypothetical protein